MTKLKIVAETGAAHRRSYTRCIALINAARLAGADAVKFSAYRPEEMTLDNNEPPFVIAEGVWAGRSLYGIYEETAIPYIWLPDLKRSAIAAGLEFILGVYHPNTVPLLRDLGVRTAKVSSFELNYTELLEELAKEDYVKGIILSTGSATEKEIADALDILKDKEVTLLYCVSKYPAAPEDMNLGTLPDMAEKFNVSVGLSNHSNILTVPVAAAVLGANMIETHIKLDNENLDASFALFPDRFALMVELVRQAEKITGEVCYGRTKTFHRKRVDGRMVRVVW